MNSSYYQNQINRLEKDIADLQKKIADENKKEIDKNKQIDSVHRTINKNTSISTLNSKQRQIDGYQKDILNCRTKIASYQKSIATKSAELGKKRQELLKAQQSEQKKLQDDQLKFQKKLQSEIEIQKRHLETLIAQNYSTQNNKLVSTEDIPEPTKQYDFFISHNISVYSVFCLNQGALRPRLPASSSRLRTRARLRKESMGRQACVRFSV